MTVSIDTRSALPDGLLERISAVADPGDGLILIVAGTDHLSGANLAECVPRTAFETALGSEFRSLAYRARAWDAGIALATKLCATASECPAVFSQIVAHEFGHATVAIRDPDLHTYCCFIDLAIQKASAGRIAKYHDLPHELAYDAFGKWVTFQLFREAQFRQEVDELVAAGRTDSERLRLLRELKPRADLSGLRAEVRAFSEPYRLQLLDLWEREVSNAKSAQRASITHQVTVPIESLWS
jgi:hypothetical protein